MRMFEAVWDTRRIELDLAGLPFMIDYIVTGANDKEVYIKNKRGGGMIIMDTDMEDYIAFRERVGSRTVVLSRSLYIEHEISSDMDFGGISFKAPEMFEIEMDRGGRKISGLNVEVTGKDKINYVDFRFSPKLTNCNIKGHRVIVDRSYKMPILYGNSSITATDFCIFLHGEGKKFYEEVEKYCSDENFKKLVHAYTSRSWAGWTPSWSSIMNQPITGLDEIIRFDFSQYDVENVVISWGRKERGFADKVFGVDYQKKVLYLKDENR